MKKILLTSAIAVALAGVIGVAAVSARDNEERTPTSDAGPDMVSNFELVDTGRLAHQLHYYKYAPAIVLVSQTNGSPLSRAAAAELGRLQAAYKDKGVLFFFFQAEDGIRGA